MAGKLSLSNAWDETRDVLGREGRLLTVVALALIALPGSVQALVTPAAPPGELPEPGVWIIVALVAIVIGIIGQLAVIRLAIGPQTSVGEAIAHGARRMPVYLGAMLLWIAPFLVLAYFLMDSIRGANPNAAAVLGFFLVMLVVLFIAVRLIIASAVASSENQGSVGILKRSWELSSGNWWRLFAFLILFLIAAMCVMIAVGAVIGVIVGLVLGAPEPMSVGALLIALVTQLAVAAVTIVFLVMLARVYLQLAGRGAAEASVPSSGT